MNIELIPVIDLYPISIETIPSPKKGPFWEYSEEWEKYINALLSHYHYNPMKSVLKGSSLYKISDIDTLNLGKIIEKHFYDLELTTFSEDELSPLYGGYILSVNGDYKLFPQCCSDLSNIRDWKGLLIEQKALFYQGHPSPSVQKENNLLSFDFVNHVFAGEKFTPPIQENILTINKEELKKAIFKMLSVLELFSEKIKLFNTQYGLNKNSELLWKKLIYGE